MDIKSNSIERRRNFAAIVIALFGTILLLVFVPELHDFGWLVFMFPITFFAFLLMIEFVMDIAEMLWKIAAKPNERLHSVISLGFSVFVLIAVFAVYKLIEGSVSTTAIIMLGAAAYVIFTVVRWFRRHTASYYAALQNQTTTKASKPVDADKARP